MNTTRTNLSHSYCLEVGEVAQVAQVGEVGEVAHSLKHAL